MAGARRVAAAAFGVVWLTSGGLVGCGGKDAVLPPAGDTLLEIYQRHAGQTGSAVLWEQRSRLRRPLLDDEPVSDPFLREGIEAARQFRRLANPDLVMFTFPHLATGDAVPIPGYLTVFPLYDRLHYALPGEAAEVAP